MDESVNSVLGARLGDAFCHLDIDELEILPLLQLVPGAEQVDDHVGPLHGARDRVAVGDVVRQRDDLAEVAHQLEVAHLEALAAVRNKELRADAR